LLLQGKHILLGITGGIAAYKSVNLLRLFQKNGAEVRVIATPSALRFIGEETLKAISRYEIGKDIFSSDPGSDWTKHIHWGEWADCFVIAPCTANSLAKISHGFSDNMLTATVLAARCPVVICPTMDGEMYSSPATQANLSTLRSRNFFILEPTHGYLASGLEATGRLPEEQDILNFVATIIHPKPKILSGKKVLITAGATREFFDPVRFISNPSTGKMGLAMAKAAIELGADVTFIHAHMSVAIPSSIKTIAVTSANDLFEAVKKCFPQTDIGIFTAAVSDYTPIQKSEHKIKKADNELVIHLQKTPDSLAWAGSVKKDSQIIIGFAMETQDLLENAQKKLIKKNADYIVANSIAENNSGFASDLNQTILLSLGDLSFQQKTMANDKLFSKAFSGLKETIAIEMLVTIFSK
jgi:phosphopantothenoylcysteine decarboxylase / phosphopantothenate---cysteine ligase